VRFSTHHRRRSGNVEPVDRDAEDRRGSRVQDAYRGRRGGRPLRQDLREHQPLYGKGLGHGARSGRRGRGRRGAGRSPGFRRGTVGQDDRHREGAFDPAPRRPPRGERRRHRRGREHGQRQAPAGDERAAQCFVGVVLLLRGGSGQDPGRDHPLRQAELLRLHPARAHRRSRGHHPVELAAPPAHLQAGPRPWPRVAP
jgi:hypothetical protein